MSCARSAHAQMHPMLGGALCESRRISACVRHLCVMRAGTCALPFGEPHAGFVSRTLADELARTSHQTYPRVSWAYFGHIRLNGLPQILSASAWRIVGSTIVAASRLLFVESGFATITVVRRAVRARSTGIAALAV